MSWSAPSAPPPYLQVLGRNAFLQLSIALVAALALTADPAAAQSEAAGDSPPAGRPRYAVGLVAGAAQFDLSGTGTTGMVGARGEAELLRWLVAEGGLGTFRPEEQFVAPRRYTVPEVQLQLQFPARTVRPYLGVGGGWVFARGRSAAVTASAAGGLRVALPGTRVDARGELRLRGIGREFGAATAEWTMGAAYRF